MSKQTIMLGMEVEDVVTGFKGIAVARVEYLSGSVRFCVEAKCIDNKPEEGQYINEEQLKVIGPNIKDKVITG